MVKKIAGVISDPDAVITYFECDENGLKIGNLVTAKKDKIKKTRLGERPIGIIVMENLE